MPTVTLRHAISADVRWLELWDDDLAVVACSTDDPAATAAFEGIDWPTSWLRSGTSIGTSSPKSTVDPSEPRRIAAKAAAAT